jgi:hypothetical protein
MLTGECVAAVRKKHHRHLDRSPMDAQVSISHLHKIPFAAS